MMELVDAVEAVKSGQSTSVQVKCPSHEDGTASLHVSRGKTQPVTVFCHAGCDTIDVIRESGIDWSEVCKPREAEVSEWTPAGVASHIYSYSDEQGTELFQVLRVPQAGGKKTFLQRRMVGDRWVWNINDTRRVIFRLPKVIEAISSGEVVYVVEGEKDVETLEAHGFTATTSPAGAGKWRPEYSESLVGARVIVIADADEPGREHARQVQAALAEIEVDAIVKETTIPGCKDITDHFMRDGRIEDLAITRTAGSAEQLPYATYIEDMVRLQFPPDDFIWNDTFAREERLLLTGHEGVGKAEFMRQASVMTAAGLHPFTGERQRPRRVLYIDAQDPEKQQQWSWQNLLRIARLHGVQDVGQRLQILSVYRWEPDLLTESGREWLHERIMAHRPDLVCMGPVQNLCGRDVKDDEVVRKFKKSIDSAREICGSAFVIEHHAPYKSGTDKERPVRPYGSSLFLKWPDFGYGLKPTEDPNAYDLHPNRLPRVRRRQWPTQLRVGNFNTAEWPWMVTEEVTGSVVVGRFGS